MLPPIITASNRSTRLLIISIIYVVFCITHAFVDDSTASIISWQYTDNNVLSQKRWWHYYYASVVPRGGSATADDDDDDDEVLMNNIKSHSTTISENKGSSNNSSSQRNTPSSSSLLLPLIDTKSVSLALRLTCETNRRLYHGTSTMMMCSGRDADDDEVRHEADNTGLHDNMMHPSYQQYKQYQQQPQHGQMIPSAIPPEIPSVTEKERDEERRKEEITIFHAIEPWTPIISSSSSLGEEEKTMVSRKGISRWGPDIDTYLDMLLCSIGLGTVDNNDDDDARQGGCESSTESTSSVTTALSTHTSHSKNQSPMEDERQLILSLTLLYLDHSISLDTPRHVDPHTGRPWYPPCPQILPQTVHRLVLTAMIIATKTVRGGGGDSSNLLREAANKLYGSERKKYTVSCLDLEQMEQWMLHSLGADASGGTGGQWQISVEDVQDFMRKWSETFYPQRLLAHDERNRSRMEKLERFWREKAGVFGGGHHEYYGGDHGHGHWNGVAADQYQQHQHY